MIITIFMGSGWPMFSKKYLDVVSGRFTARYSFCEMATGDRLRVAQISHQLFRKIIIVIQIPREV